MARKGFYNQAEASVVFDGVVATKIAGGDAIRVVDDSTGATKTPGLKGTLTSVGTDNSGYFEMDLFPTSPLWNKIYNMKNRQSQGSGRLFDVMVSTGVGERVNCQRCAIEKAGDIGTGGPEGKMRTVRCTVENIQWPESA